MRVGVKDVAAMAGVSKTAVSLYLNNHPHAETLSDKTKQRIDDAIRKTGYKPSATARALSSGKTKTIGLVVGGIANAYFAHFAETCLNESMGRGYQLVLSLCRWDKEEEQSCLENLINRQVDGILYYPELEKDSAVYKKLCKNHSSVLLIEQDSNDFSTIRNDIWSAMKNALSRLKELGHFDVSGVFSTDTVWNSAFNCACKEFEIHGQSLNLELNSKKTRMIAIKEILRSRPNAIIINGRLTANLLLHEMSINYPDYKPDIVINYDYPCDIIFSNLIVGIIYCHTSELAHNAIKILIKTIENDCDFPEHILIPAEFITRDNFSDQLYEGIFDQ